MGFANVVGPRFRQNFRLIFSFKAKIEIQACLERGAKRPRRVVWHVRRGIDFPSLIRIV